MGPQPQAAWRRWLRWAKWAWLGFLLYCLPWFAGTPRFDRLGAESFWYDEVVTARMTQEPTVPSALRLLKRIDATRAPLHPLALRLWLRLVGYGEAEARSLSATCGVVTVLATFSIAWRLGGLRGGLWAAFFATLSPLLVEYDREARMYAMLTMLSTLAWWNLLRFRDRSTTGRAALQVLLTTALAYAHPLGLLMIVALAAGWVSDLRQTRLSPGRWLAIQAVAGALVAPWVGNYLDHPPEFLTPGQSLKLLAGMPIGFTGGHSGTLALCVVVILVGLVPFAVAGLSRSAMPARGSAWPLVAWLVVPPTLLFAYSLVAHPIFGPSRYNVFVAPAYLILLSRGLSRVNLVPSLMIGTCLLLAFSFPATMEVHDSQRKADWRGAAKWLESRAPGAPLVVISPREGETFELETARFYVGDSRQVVAYSEDARDPLRGVLGDSSIVLFVTPIRGGTPLRPIPDSIRRWPIPSPISGLRIYGVTVVRKGLPSG